MSKLCPNCKSGNSDDATFCQNCGENLNSSAQATQKVETPNNSGATGWWGKQSKRNKTALGIGGVCCIGLIIIIAIFGIFSPDNTTNTANTNPTTPSTPTVTGTQVQVSYDGPWSGAIDQDGSSQTVDGNGTETFNMTGNPSVVSVDFQKQDGSSGTFTVNILQNGNVVKTESTSAQYGVASTVTDF